MTTELRAPAIGERIRELRNGLMTQTDLAAAADVSPDLIRKLEQSRRNTASLASLHRIARALDVDLADLLGRQAMPDAAPDAGVVTLRRAMADVDDLLGEVQGEPLSLRDAERSVIYLWGTYWSGKYEVLTGLIPQALVGLRSTLYAASGADRARAVEYLAQGYWIAGSTLAQLRQPDAAFMAVRRAVDLATQSDDGLLVAMLKGSVSWQLMVGGRFEEAARVAIRTARDIEPRGDVTMPQLAAYGSLLISAATAAGRANRVTEARDLLNVSGEVAQRVGTDRTDYQTPFGPSQVTMQTVDVGVVTEDYPAALEAARQMPPNPGLPVAARCRHLADRAYAHSKLGHNAEALNLLLTAEGVSPDWIRHQTLVRSITRDLLEAERARSTPLRELAHRIGLYRTWSQG